jgi:hypothetical protein
MKNNPLNQYSEYRIRDIVSRLECFRSSIGWGELSDDLEVAIDCLEYLIDCSKVPAPVTEYTEQKEPPHWKVMEHGFAGRSFECSVCGKIHWDLTEDTVGQCPDCHTVMDLSATKRCV